MYMHLLFSVKVVTFGMPKSNTNKNDPATNGIYCKKISCDWGKTYLWVLTRPRGYKTFFKLSSAEHEISTADKCLNGKKLWNIQVQNSKTGNLSCS